MFLVVVILACLTFNVYSVYENSLVLQKFKHSIELLGSNIYVDITQDNNLSINIPKNMWKKLVYSNIYIVSYTIQNDRILMLAKPEARRFYLLKNEENSVIQQQNCSYIIVNDK